VATLKVDVEDVPACTVTPDGRRVVLALEDNTHKVWDFKRGCA